MRPLLTILVLLSLQNVGSSQLLSSNDDIPLKFELANKVPDDLGAKATLTFVKIQIIFDWGSFVAEFQKNDGGRFLIWFPLPGYWTKDAKKNRTQPIAVLVEGDGVKAYPEVERGSEYEKRMIQLLNDDLSNNKHSAKQIKDLKRVRDTIRDRTPLREIRERFPSAFKN